MNEPYKFSETRNPLKQLELSKNEIETVSNLGLTFEDLRKLLSGQSLAEGSYALIFELPGGEKSAIAKVWKNPQHDEERAKHEDVALRLLRRHNSEEAPRTLGYLESATILFEEKIEGNHIENFDETVIAQLAETLAKVHSIELNSYGKPLTSRKSGTQLDYLNDELKKLRKDSSFLTEPSEITSLIERAIDKIENEAQKKLEAFQNNKFTLIHFDLNRNNILQSRDANKIILIDWEQASAGDNAMDIAKLFLKLNFKEYQKREFLKEYEGRLAKKDENFEERLEIYKALVLVNSILWRQRVLKDRPPSIILGNEQQFYDRVQSNLEQELRDLQIFLKKTAGE